MFTQLNTCPPVPVDHPSESHPHPHAPPTGDDRARRAWETLSATGKLPDDGELLRPEIGHAWRRCLIEHRLPPGGDQAKGEPRPVPGMITGFGGADFVDLLGRISPLLKGTRLSLLVATPDARLLHIAENQLEASPLMRDLARRGSDWREAALGNNGVGTAALLGIPAAFSGREHFSKRLHAFCTVGYPLEGPDGRVAGVIGLVGDCEVAASVLLGVMGLIMRLLQAETPLRSPSGFDTAFRFVERGYGGESDRAVGTIYRDTLADDLVRQAARLQARNIPILITGESGVGKEHLVRLIHAAGCRRDGPMVAINCASIPRDLIESELFGYEGGSFTGARSQGKPGKFLLASKGVLFLDEIGDMSFDLQATLLRVLENGEFVPVGGAKPIKADVHVIAATNIKLLDAVEQGRFRRDLYYRLNGAQFRLPPLRERPDKRQLIESLLVRECAQAEVEPKRLDPNLMDLFLGHPWPGNIRELRNLLRNLVSVVNRGVLEVGDLPIDFLEEMGFIPRQDPAPQAPATPPPMAGPTALPPHPGTPSLEDWECLAIESALRQADGNVAETARILGISRSTLYVKLQRYNLTPPRRPRPAPVGGQPA
ncbi:regulatory protein, Fis family [Methylomagnum ishizawai]|uniref:Regulatory protein, Fis family n=1 Tax=Methylomagnum ishizawai TaxID=1760988 RepID=A0A1Y6DBX7_9GAMM|nr:sigma 54-interacting transcriptional regulator [Methylomagnum ishizawai]SMF97115.1 regulatory protein, Fis family [Methylomagnum ishizawai]